MLVKIFIYFKILFLFLFTLTSSCHAITREEVLGAEADDLTIPPTVEGPGYILPDSPFYFLDQIKQSIRVVFAFSQEEKARVYANIAGERMAELRFMLQKQNENAVRVALNGVSENYKNAQEQLGKAKMAGKDVSELAKEINDSIKLKQQVLDELGMSAKGEMGLQAQAASEGLTEAKIRMEEYLSTEDLASEIRYDVDRELSLRLNEASTSAQALTVALEDLKKQRQQAAEQSLKNREEALNKAIEQQNEKIRKQEQLALDQEKKDFENKLRLEQQAIERVQANVEKAQQAAIEYQDLQQTNR